MQLWGGLYIEIRSCTWSGTLFSIKLRVDSIELDTHPMFSLWEEEKYIQIIQIFAKNHIPIVQELRFRS